MRMASLERLILVSVVALLIGLGLLDATRTPDREESIR